MIIIIMVIRDVINLSNNLSLVESFLSTSGNIPPSDDTPIVISKFDILLGCIRDKDIRFAQAICVFFSIVSP